MEHIGDFKKIPLSKGNGNIQFVRKAHSSNLKVPNTKESFGKKRQKRHLCFVREKKILLRVCLCLTKKIWLETLHFSTEKKNPYVPLSVC